MSRGEGINIDTKLILGPGGEPLFGVGGRAAWKTMSSRGFNVSLEWAKSGKHILRLLCIWPEASVLDRPDAPTVGVWAIAHTAMLDFLDFNPDDKMTGFASAHCWLEAQEALPILGKDRNDKAALFALIDIVTEFGPMVASMPAAPQSVRRDLADEPIWQMETVNKSTGQTIREEEV